MGIKMSQNVQGELVPNGTGVPPGVIVLAPAAVDEELGVCGVATEEAAVLVVVCTDDSALNEDVIGGVESPELKG